MWELSVILEKSSGACASITAASLTVSTCRVSESMRCWICGKYKLCEHTKLIFCEQYQWSPMKSKCPGFQQHMMKRDDNNSISNVSSYRHLLQRETCSCIDKFRMLWLHWATHRKVWHKMAVQTAILCHTYLCVAQGNQSMRNSSIEHWPEFFGSGGDPCIALVSMVTTLCEPRQYTSVSFYLSSTWHRYKYPINVVKVLIFKLTQHRG